MIDTYQLNRPYGCCTNEENLERVFFVTKNSVKSDDGVNFEDQAHIAVASICNKCGFINDSHEALIYLTNNKKILNLLDFKFNSELLLELQKVLRVNNITKIVFNQIEPLEAILQIIKSLNLTIIPLNAHNAEKTQTS